MSAGRAGTHRTEWVDAAKGVTILLVVLHHVIWPMIDAGLKVQWWVPVDATLNAVRMPAFFLLAGLFASKVVHAESGVGLWRDRVGKFAYLFVLWTTMRVGFYATVAAAQGDPVLPEVLDRLGRLARGVSPLWFIAALAVFFAIARAVRRVPPALQVAAAAVLSAAILATGSDSLPAKMWLLPVFMVGVNYGASIRRVAAPVNRLTGGGAAAVLRWIGQRTLPIYLMHVPALSVLLVCPPLVAALRFLTPVAPVVLTLLATGLSLLVYRMVRGTPGLFDLPRPVNVKERSA